MSKSDWRLHPPTGVGLICVALLAIAGLDNHRQQRAAYEQASAYEYGVTAPPRTIPTPPANPRPNRNEWRQERDLQAQREMAQWALWMVIISSVGVVITGVGLLLVRETLRYTAEQALATAEQVRIARREFRYGRRPLLEIAIIDSTFGRITDDGEEIQPRASYVVTNVGDGDAIISEFRIEIGLFQRPPIPEPENMHHYEWADVFRLPPGEWYGSIVERHRAVTPQELVDLEDLSVTPYCFGFVRYSDRAGHGWEFGFCAEYPSKTHDGEGFSLIRDRPYFFDREAKED